MEAAPADEAVDETMLDHVKVLAYITLPYDDFVLDDLALLHRAEDACFLLLVEVPENEVICNGSFDSAHLIICLWIDRQWLVANHCQPR